jgi:hypothetical protein
MLEKQDKNFGALLCHLNILPEQYKRIAFCMYCKVKPHSGSEACRMSIDQYKRRRALLKKHMECYRLYVLNKKEYNKLFRDKLTIHQYLVFIDLVKNPFQTSSEIAKVYNVTSGAIRNLIYNIIHKLTKEKDLEMFLKLFKEVVFGRLKKLKIKTLELM